MGTDLGMFFAAYSSAIVWVHVRGDIFEGVFGRCLVGVSWRFLGDVFQECLWGCLLRVSSGDVVAVVLGDVFRHNFAGVLRRGGSGGCLLGVSPRVVFSLLAGDVFVGVFGIQQGCRWRHLPGLRFEVCPCAYLRGMSRKMSWGLNKCQLGLSLIGFGGRRCVASLRVA